LKDVIIFSVLGLDPIDNIEASVTCLQDLDLMALEFTATLLEDQISFRCLLQSGWRRVPVFWAVFWI